MHKYDNPYLSAIEEFKDKYLILYIGTIFSVLGVAIILKTRNYDEAFYVYLFVSTITIVLVFFYWYWMCLKHIKIFMININDAGLEINNKQIMISEIKEVYTTRNNELIIFTNNERYKVYKSLSKYNELLDTIKSIVIVQSKSDTRNKITYALDLFLFILFFLINIPYIVIPIGLYLLFSYIRRIVIIIKNATSIISINLVISLFIVIFIGYKLILHLRVFI